MSSKSFVVGGIYWFVNPKISSSDPHPHVCLGEYEDECILLFCGTSQFEKKVKYFEKNNIPYETLVRIQSNITNSLTKDTYINCNEIQSHAIQELNANSSFKHIGVISDSEMYQIKNGVFKSELLEERVKDHILSILPDFD